MAVFLAISSREVISKIVSVWFPVMCFVGLGTDHVIANMYFIPLAIFLGAPKPLTVGYYIWKSMIPSLLGNIVGGGLFTGAVYWYLYLAGTDVPIHFDAMPLDSMNYGRGVSSQNMVTTPGEVSEYMPESKHDRMVPDSGNGAISGIANDLHGGHFKKEKHTTEASV
jgi:hypothetical protein